MSGTFIVFEGPDGSGTTLHAKLLTERLKSTGNDVISTYEPSDGPIGKRIRKSLHSFEDIPPFELQKMFCEDRDWHIENIIKPALDKGKTVISDRYICSTICYGAALGLSKSKLIELNKDFIQPDCVFFILPPYDICKERIGRRDKKDILEEKELQKRVYAEYKLIAGKQENDYVIDTSVKKQQASDLIFDIVKNL